MRKRKKKIVADESALILKLQQEVDRKLLQDYIPSPLLTSEMHLAKKKSTLQRDSKELSRRISRGGRLLIEDLKKKLI